jgi:RNA polymerase sigma factor (sigma-70 family)|uniref:Sigma-70 family RNA polymerase sigma factor n=1 Tax=Desulfomonile tiedjei TaxID=2358 RepID=A0A7C4AS32_9BACT
MNKSVDDAEATLVRQCLAGSETAWRELYGRFVVLVRNVISKHARLTEPEIDDITQTVFLTLTSALRNFDAQHSLSSFICLVTERVLVDELRKGSAAKRSALTLSVDNHDGSDEASQIQSPEDLPDVLIERFEQALLLRTALDQIDADCRDLLKLRYFKGLSFNEIAVMLGVAENTLNVRANRCLTKLKAAYKLCVTTRAKTSRPTRLTKC